MKITTLKQGNYTVNKNRQFMLIEDPFITLGPKIAVQPFLVITGNDIILLDTGLGCNIEEEPVIYKCLNKENILPGQITKVLISHLHKDHIDGVGHFLVGKFISNFPNAKIYVQQRELDFALTQRGNPSYTFEVLDKLATLTNLVMLSDDKGNITDEIFYEVCGGHTPFHQVFWIREKEETIFYGADDLPQQSYLKLHLAFKNDYDGKKASELRRKWEKEAIEEHWSILFYHDLEVPILHF